MNITDKKQSRWLILFMVCFPVLTAGLVILFWGSSVLGAPLSLEKGSLIPSVTVIGKDGKAVNLDTLKGHVTLISIVPQLNTPVCDEQTHRFSERNGGLDQMMTFVTLSTNTYEDQQTFATEANIHNMTFLSDAPDYHFGASSGLLLEQPGILHRAVVVLDYQGIIRYVEMVPMGQLPDFDQALRVSRSLLANVS
ncbi:redoxin family protein [Candidatus Nitrospira allomarina]|jgi:thioredoxin-dependent peroxiredoxin|uniref:Redoxin family protein n=1 Tax=Candidatus Nitrospira allomarina TaxID=3020900 RepID=A0AA96JRZ8_9BACT|nr:redoxin family protein [Candidatus Nitrospira allomarina]WNM58077.1 redoxin family protein [Candidatus Nitrospira allomarina]